MRTCRITWVFVLGLATSVVLAASPAKEKEDPKETKLFTDTFNEEKSDLISVGRNPFFILEPGYVLKFQGAEDDEKVELVITVLNETKQVDGVETRIVEERESADGKVVEVSRNYYAISKRTNSVYYFGEDSKEYKDGKVTGTGGSWESGVNGAHYGLMIPGTILLGSRYYQEIAPKEAMDRAENVSNSEAVETPAGKFTGCLKTEETTPLEPKAKEYKLYAPGVGLVRDADLNLVSYGKSNSPAKP